MPAGRRGIPDLRLGERTLRRLSSVVWVLVVVSAAAFIATFLRQDVVTPYYIPSASMEPTLHGCPGCDEDRILVDRLSYHLHSPHLGDVVVFHRPSTWKVDDKVLVKRVIGLPGDVLTVHQGGLFINGREIEEPYLKHGCEAMTSLSEAPRPPHITRIGPIPPGEVFVMGDNRCNSEDSRAFGPVPESDIIGRAFVIVWPLDRIHYL